MSERVVFNYIRHFKHNILKQDLNQSKDTFINQYANETDEDIDVNQYIKNFKKIGSY